METKPQHPRYLEVLETKHKTIVLKWERSSKSNIQQKKSFGINKKVHVMVMSIIIVLLLVTINILLLILRRRSLCNLIENEYLSNILNAIISFASSFSIERSSHRSKYFKNHRNILKLEKETNDYKAMYKDQENQNESRRLNTGRVSSQSVTITEDTVYIMNNVVGQVTCTLNGNCAAIVWYLSSIPTPVASTFIGYSCLNTTNGYYQKCDEENHKYTLYFTATTNLHGKTIRCSAEGCTSQQNVSDIVTIFVIVPVPSVALEGISSHQITVTAAESKSITCVTGASRPAPRILWYIGVTNVTSLSTETQIPSQELFYTRSNLTFIPTKSQNGLQINCKAYNTDNNMMLMNNVLVLFNNIHLLLYYFIKNNSNNTELIWLYFTDAIWTLIGSSEFAVTGEPFTLICNPHDNNFLALAIYWKRFDIDANGTFRAVVEKTGCKIGPGYDTQYQYTCEPGPLYKLTIPANVMTNSQNNIEWRCGSLFGGAEAYFTITVAISSLSLHADNTGNQQVNVMYENIPKAFHCITNGCRPQANVTVTTTGVTKGQLTESTTQNGDLIITRVSQVITTNRGGSTAKTLQCLAVNIQGRQPITSQLITLNVYCNMHQKKISSILIFMNIPSVEPTLIGYINGTILYEGDSDLKLTCQQSGGYPRSVITWSCDRKAGTTNNGHTVASSYVQLTLSNLISYLRYFLYIFSCFFSQKPNSIFHNCQFEISYKHVLTLCFVFSSPISLNKYLLIPPTTPTLQTLDTSFPWIENTQGVLRCIITPGNPPQTTYDWIQNSQVINGQTTDTYTIPTLSNVHNGLRIQCRGSNLYTRNRPPAKISQSYH
ncbi:hypothetical protein KUTeg_002865 [Tegillarca granosa]|uniref:Ig-like domain-containing protein n=1 Tax=Tegillarca granosa TaxID=220873 RepID=A0ABQ9FQL1_TEGGR|nr:hypothetical protein KUTeg_002865 [Tegillarca granosa]